MEEKNLDYYIRLLEANKNLILTGAPGTGKTYLAKAIADKMEAEYEFVQFHPSYDYTDFVEGLRPTPPDKNGNIGFERKDGVFKEFCKRAIEKCKGLSTESSINISKNSIDENDKIEKAMSWLMKQNGATLKSIRSETKFTLVINQNRIYLRIPKGNENYVNPNGVIRYLKTGEYDKEHQTYEPSVGFFIKENCPLYTKDTSNNHILHKDILPPKEKQFVLENRKEEKIKHFIFIIDEINRGEISKIFGELFFSIDPSYRGEKGLVKTQYQNLITDESDPFYEGFYVPENVYIIGTMNDIDRSVESMDFAMRRRFAWVEIKANEHTGMLDEELADMKEEIVQVMTRLNAAIWDEENHTGIEGLSPAYHIGGSYFSKLALYLDNERTHKEAAYKHLWENHLKGVLFEYLRGTANAMENLEMLEQVYYQKKEKMTLKDNSTYSSTSENLEAFLSLQNVANRTLSELTDECGNNLLIYPYSFEECEDKIGNQPLMSLQANWKGKQCTKVHLTTGNLVGFIGVNGHSVSIQSRFVQHTGEDFFLHYMLQKVLYLNLFRMPHETSDKAVFDFLLYLFPKFLHEALAQGIYKEYQHNAYNDANVRGVIDISRQIKYNMPFNGRIAYRTREFCQDNQVTELIRHTLEYICTTRFGRALLENDIQTRDNVSQIRTATPNYHRQDRENVIRHNLKIIPHPYFTHYAPLQKLCLRILRHEKSNTDSKRIRYTVFCLMRLICGKNTSPLSSQSKGSRIPTIKKVPDASTWLKGTNFPVTWTFSGNPTEQSWMPNTKWLQRKERMYINSSRTCIG